MGSNKRNGPLSVCNVLRELLQMGITFKATRYEPQDSLTEQRAQTGRLRGLLRQSHFTVGEQRPSCCKCT